MYNYPQKALSWFLDTVFPKICVGCGKFTNKDDFDYVCRKCFGGLELKNSFECIGCKRDTRLGLTCAFCAKDNNIAQLIIATDLSDSLVEKMLKAYKYKFIADMYLPLTVIARKSVKKLLKKGFNLIEDDPLFVPVPLHKARLNERGFNQSWLIAKNMADAFHMASEENVLSKKYNFKHQVNTGSREERLNNIKDNFYCSGQAGIGGRTIILVDDICTTGATINECARVLKAAGAKRVIGFVIARGQFKKISNY